MLKSLTNALLEARAAFRAADDGSSRLQLACDFFASRLLWFKSMPGRDRMRSARIRGFDLRYRFNRGDLQSIREVLLEDTYRLPFALSGVTHALDLGANLGLWSLWAQREYNLQRIIAAEPEPGNADLTRKNFAANGSCGEVVQAAIGGMCGTVAFARRLESNLGQIVTKAQGPAGSEVVSVVQKTVADLLARFADDVMIDIVKMDIEGAEEAVFAADISWLARVRALIIEWHPDRCDPLPMIAKIESAGFEHHPANTARQDNLSAFLRR